ncbi:hypothetical protein IFM89_021023 [Coptis chinensis]|uniref:Protein kinase domain-containing protein n=1 Tax=Coptis chinensis TaxID=261450 RepID=A0A835H7R6_9MAGN|nr:hypothetical protein IFM89_021023 [Coptis chinensis]
MAKPHPTRDISVVSMVGARGTIGYIAPEVCCRNFGGVSHKSDVYSYGMMVLEMIGGRKNIDVAVENMKSSGRLNALEAEVAGAELACNLLKKYQPNQTLILGDSRYLMQLLRNNGEDAGWQHKSE